MSQEANEHNTTQKPGVLWRVGRGATRLGVGLSIGQHGANNITKGLRNLMALGPLTVGYAKHLRDSWKAPRATVPFAQLCANMGWQTEAQIEAASAQKFWAAWMLGGLAVLGPSLVAAGVIGGSGFLSQSLSAVGMVALFGGYTVQEAFWNYRLRHREQRSGARFIMSPGEWFPRLGSRGEGRKARREAINRSARACWISLAAAAGSFVAALLCPVKGPAMMVFLLLALLIAMTLSLGNAASAALENYRLRRAGEDEVDDAAEPRSLGEWAPQSARLPAVASKSKSGQSGTKALKGKTQTKAM